MGFIVKAMVGDMEENTREGRSKIIRKELVGCVQNVVGKKRFLVQFGDGQKKDMSFVSLVFLSTKEEVNMDNPLTKSPKKKKANC